MPAAFPKNFKRIPLSRYFLTVTCGAVVYKKFTKERREKKERK